MNNENQPHLSYETIEDIRLQKVMLQKAIQKDEYKMQSQWHSLFYRPAATNGKTTTSRRISNLMNTGAGVLDAFILGWKLYRKFRR